MRDIDKNIDLIKTSSKPINVVVNLFNTFGVEYLYALIARAIECSDIDIANTIYAGIKIEMFHRANLQSMEYEENKRILA